MPFPADAIKGKADIRRKREKLAREAKESFSKLPDWMFYDDEKMKGYLEKEIRTDADNHQLMIEICQFVRLAICIMGYYEERE
jgi:hypothetical protein